MEIIISVSKTTIYGLETNVFSPFNTIFELEMTFELSKMVFDGIEKTISASKTTIFGSETNVSKPFNTIFELEMTFELLKMIFNGLYSDNF